MDDDINNFNDINKLIEYTDQLFQLDKNDQFDYYGDSHQRHKQPTIRAGRKLVEQYGGEHVEHIVHDSGVSSGDIRIYRDGAGHIQIRHIRCADIDPQFYGE